LKPIKLVLRRVDLDAMRALLLAWLLIVAAPATADLFRCSDAAGDPIFTDEPSRCANGTAVKLKAGAQPAPAAAPPARRAPSGWDSELARGADLLPSAADVAGHWTLVRDAVDGPDRDPDLREWGVLSRDARHYTRDGAAGVQVCSLEVWRFEREAAARRAGDHFAYPGWEIERRGRVLVMVHALSVESADRRAIFPACSALRSDVLVRAARVRPD
jgi:hypothetical protein